MKRTTFAAIMLAGIGLAALPESAEARGVGGNTSQVWWYPNFQNCFYEYFGGVRTADGSGNSTCPDGRYYTSMPVITSLPVDNGGVYRNVWWATEGGNQAWGAIYCQAYSMNTDYGYYQSARVNTNPSGARFQTISASVYVAPWGDLESVCNLVYRGQGLVSVSWDQ